MMGHIRSINEPDTPVMPGVLGGSINEPVTIPEGAATPVISALTPDGCTIGDPSFTMFVSGSGFFAASVIVFAGHDEPTTLNADGTLSTGINMDVWQGPDTVQVSIRNGAVMSNEMPFTFAAAGTRVADPDDMEEEIEAAEDDGDFKPTHRGRSTHTLPHKRKR